MEGIVLQSNKSIQFKTELTTKNMCSIDIDESFTEADLMREGVFYECIGRSIANEKGELITKVFFDFDCKSSDDIGFDLTDEDTFGELRKHINRMLRMKSLENKYVWTDGSYYENAKTYKLSFHIIFFDRVMDKRFFTSECNNEIFEQYLKLIYTENKHLDFETFKKCIDKSVYGQKQLFRLPYATCSKKPHPHLPVLKKPKLCTYFLTFFENAEQILLAIPQQNEQQESGFRRTVNESNLTDVDLCDNDNDNDDDELEKEKEARKDREKQRKNKVLKLLSIINPQKRAFSYSSWFELLCICKNENIGFDVFDRISKQSGYKYYSKSECESKFNDFEPRNEGESKLGMKRLIEWAKEDNPKETDKILMGDLATNILKNSSHFNCAELLSMYIDGEIFYTSAFGWIIFDKVKKIWTYNNKKEDLVYYVSKFFSLVINARIKFLSNKKEQTDKDKEDLIAFTKLLKTVGSCGWALGVITQLQGIVNEDNKLIEKFDNNPALIAFSDGKVIDLKNEGKVREMTKEDYIMTTTGYPYPAKRQTDIDEVMKFVEGLHDDREMTDSVLTMMSNALYGKNINNNFFVWTGSACNGKGTLDALFRTTLGNYYSTMDISQLTAYAKESDRANSGLASTRFARCVMVSEPEVSNDSETTLKVGTIKKFTGEDPITARFLHRDSFTFTPKFTLYLQCNDIPKLSKKDGGIERRMKIIEFPFKFNGQEGQELDENQKIGDPFIKETVTSDRFRNAFIHILVNTWVKHKGKFFIPQKVIASTNEYLSEQNPIREWFFENYELDQEGRMNSEELMTAYNNQTYDKLNSKMFGRYLKEVCKQIKSGGKMKYLCKPKSTTSRFQSPLPL